MDSIGPARRAQGLPAWSGARSLPRRAVPRRPLPPLPPRCQADLEYKRAADRGFEQHASQVKTDEGNEKAVPSWRKEQIELRKEEENEDLAELAVVAPKQYKRKMARSKQQLQKVEIACSGAFSVPERETTMYTMCFAPERTEGACRAPLPRAGGGAASARTPLGADPPPPFLRALSISLSRLPGIAAAMQKEDIYAIIKMAEQGEDVLDDLLVAGKFGGVGGDRSDTDDDDAEEEGGGEAMEGFGGDAAAQLTRQQKMKSGINRNRQGRPPCPRPTATPCPSPSHTTAPTHPRHRRRRVRLCIASCSTRPLPPCPRRPTLFSAKRRGRPRGAAGLLTLAAVRARVAGGRQRGSTATAVTIWRTRWRAPAS